MIDFSLSRGVVAFAVAFTLFALVSAFRLGVYAQCRRDASLRAALNTIGAEIRKYAIATPQPPALPAKDEESHEPNPQV
jgi:hypothetical protein